MSRHWLEKDGRRWTAVDCDACEAPPEESPIPGWSPFWFPSTYALVTGPDVEDVPGEDEEDFAQRFLCPACMARVFPTWQERLGRILRRSHS